MMNKVLSKILLALAIATGFAVWQHYKRQDQLITEPATVMVPIEQPQSGTASDGLTKVELCKGKKFCAVVYVAPWCPACKHEAPRYRGYLANGGRDSENGIQIIVGQGKTREDNNETVRSYGEGALADHEGTLARELAVPHFPSHFVLDQNRAVVLRDPQAARWMADKFR